MRLGLAFRAFYLALFSQEAAARIDLALRGEPATPALSAPTPAPAKETAKAPARSEALTLLATLQREARLVDFVKESLTGFSDAQIGAVARDIHRDCGQVLERLFVIAPAIPQNEGETVTLPADFDAGRYKLVGNVGGQSPPRGQLLHHGWEATQCSLPTWNGNPASARVLAPAEVEIK